LTFALNYFKANLVPTIGITSMALPFLIGHKTHFEIDIPQRLSINSMHYVMWLDKLGKFNILSDVCPHIGASLARGSIKYIKDRSCVQCPFHTQLFYGDGYRVGNTKSRMTVPPVLYEDKGTGLVYFLEKADDYQFVPDFSRIGDDESLYCGGVTTPRLVKSSFEKILSISNDLNHVTGTHNDYFHINQFKVSELKELAKGDFYTRATVGFEKFTLLEKLARPNLFLITNNIEQEFYNFFPTMFLSEAKSGGIKFYQIIYYYPVNDEESVVGGMYYTNMPRVINGLTRKASLEAIDMIITQDMFETENQYDQYLQMFELEHDKMRTSVIDYWRQYKDDPDIAYHRNRMI
jgi:nitrite reductase/ring-hydroxylating ferredoxin subunit